MHVCNRASIWYQLSCFVLVSSTLNIWQSDSWRWKSKTNQPTWNTISGWSKTARDCIGFSNRFQQWVQVNSSMNSKSYLFELMLLHKIWPVDFITELKSVYRLCWPFKTHCNYRKSLLFRSDFELSIAWESDSDLKPKSNQVNELDYFYSLWNFFFEMHTWSLEREQIYFCE